MSALRLLNERLTMPDPLAGRLINGTNSSDRSSHGQKSASRVNYRLSFIVYRYFKFNGVMA